MSRLNEKILLYRIKSRHDKDAFGQLYDAYVEKVYRFVFLKVSHKQEAEDITADVFFKIWNYLINHYHKEVKSFSGLVFSIARNNVVDWYRERAKTREYIVDEIGSELPGLAEKEKLDTEQEINILLHLIRTLKQEYQEVLILRYVDDMSIGEIAKITGKNRTAARVLLFRAKKKLRELVERN